MGAGPVKASYLTNGMGEDGIDDLPLPFEGDYEGNLWAGSEMALLILFQHFQTVIFATASEPLPTTRRCYRHGQ